MEENYKRRQLALSFSIHHLQQQRQATTEQNNYQQFLSFLSPLSFIFYCIAFNSSPILFISSNSQYPILNTKPFKTWLNRHHPQPSHQGHPQWSKTTTPFKNPSPPILASSTPSARNGARPSCTSSQPPNFLTLSTAPPSPSLSCPSPKTSISPFHKSYGS